MRASIIAIASFLIATSASADDLTDMMNSDVSQYIKANPAPIRKAETPADVVRVWRDMVVVGDMIQLAEDNALPMEMRPQIVRRLDAALAATAAAIGKDDRQVGLLAGITMVYAKAAMAYGKKRIPYDVMGDARLLLISPSTMALARDLEKKYTTPGSIVPPEKPVKW